MGLTMKLNDAKINAFDKSFDTMIKLYELLKYSTEKQYEMIFSEEERNQDEISAMGDATLLMWIKETKVKHYIEREIRDTVCYVECIRKGIEEGFYV